MNKDRLREISSNLKRNRGIGLPSNICGEDLILIEALIDHVFPPTTITVYRFDAERDNNTYWEPIVLQFTDRSKCEALHSYYYKSTKYRNISCIYEYQQKVN